MPIYETRDPTTRCRWDTDAGLYQRFVVGLDAVETLVEERALDASELAQFAQNVTDNARQVNRDQLVQAARTALQTNHDYLALGTPTNAQAAAQIAALTRQNDALIRLVGALVGSSDLLDQVS